MWGRLDRQRLLDFIYAHPGAGHALACRHCDLTPDALESHLTTLRSSERVIPHGAYGLLRPVGERVGGLVPSARLLVHDLLHRYPDGAGGYWAMTRRLRKQLGVSSCTIVRAFRSIEHHGAAQVVRGHHLYAMDPTTRAWIVNGDERIEPVLVNLRVA